MKLYSYSEVPPKQPYFHMGYLSTTSVRPNKEFLGTSVVFLIIGMILAVKVVVTGGNWNKSVMFIIKKEGKWVKPGVVVLVIGLAILTMAFVFGRVVPNHPDSITYMKMSVIEHAGIDALLEAGDKTFDPEKLWKMETIEEEVWDDGWGNRMRIVKEVEKGEDVYYIISAGENEKLGDDDDIRRSLTEVWKHYKIIEEN